VSRLIEAVDWAFRLYRENPGMRRDVVEHGCIFWERNGLLDRTPEPPRKGNRPGEIDLYDLQAGLDIMLEFLVGNRTYLGDYHTHTDSSAYPTELPSDSDIFQWGAICDLCPIWRLWKPLQSVPELIKLKDRDWIPVCPRLQLVQPMRYGDLIQIVPVKGRPVFETIAEQDSSLEPLKRQYKQLLRQTGHAGSIREGLQKYREEMKLHVTGINALLGQRIRVDYVENPTPPTH
jgi:hypothetical protein